MDGLFFIIIGFLVVLLAAAAAVIFSLLQKKKPRQDNEALLMLHQQLNHIREALDDKLSESAKAMQIQHGQTTKIVSDVIERLTKIDETNRQVVGVAEQLQGLENILKNPKQRGILGEYYLEELLRNVFPPNQYQMQYMFKDGQVVDAVIFLRDNKIIPIDSKFSLENYNRIIGERDAARREQLERVFKQDLKSRIEETARYIRPGENTLEFAFMFIPAEAVYYDLLVNKIGAIKSATRDLIEYAVRERHVIPVSPTSFYAYLQTILQGLRAMQIEKSAMEIRKRVEMLARHLASYETYLQRLGGHLGTTVSTYNKAYKEFAKMDKDVVKITEGEKRVEAKQLQGPSLEE